MGLLDTIKGWIGIDKESQNEIKSLQELVSYIETLNTTKQNTPSPSVEEVIVPRGIGEDSFIRIAPRMGRMAPQFPIPLSWFRNVVYYSDTIRNIIRILRVELFKNGLEVRPRFVAKCTKCGMEFNEKVEKCTVCGGEVREPNEKEREWLLDWMEDVNVHDQPLIEVLGKVEDYLNIYDNAFILIRKKYYFNAEGEVSFAEVKEIQAVNPEKIVKVINKWGEPAKDERGRILYFCLEHRDKTYPDITRCPICGKKMFPAYYSGEVAGGEIQYFTKGEVLWVSKWTNTTLYGVPPLLSVFRKVMTLILIERYLYMRYYLQRAPQGLLVVRTRNYEEFQRAWNWVMTQTKDNPHLIYPLVVTEGADASGKELVQYIPFSTEMDDTVAMELMRGLQISIGAVYGVSPLFFGETKGGVSNEGLQITITNRALEIARDVYNEKILPWILKQLGINDWIIQVAPVEQRDIMAELDILERKIDLMEKLRDLGFEVEVIRTGDDPMEFDVKIVDVPKRYGGTGTEAEEEEQEETTESEPEALGEMNPDAEYFQGEPEHSRASNTQRFQGEPKLPLKEAKKELGTVKWEGELRQGMKIVIVIGKLAKVMEIRIKGDKDVNATIPIKAGERQIGFINKITEEKQTIPLLYKPNIGEEGQEVITEEVVLEVEQLDKEVRAEIVLIYEGGEGNGELLNS